MTFCKFFAQGFCRNGDSCNFVHEQGTNKQNYLAPIVSASSAIEMLNINEAKSAPICTFFMQGSCNRGSKCRYTHPSSIMPPQQVLAGAVSQNPCTQLSHESPPQIPSDSRARVPCKFLSRLGGCKNSSCPYLHDLNGLDTEKYNGQNSEANEDEDQEYEDNFTRHMLGASVYFNEFGHVAKVSLPADFSLACITGLAPGTTPKEVVEILRVLGFDVDIDCVRILASTTLPETKATVKVEDPQFAKELSARLKNQRSALSAVPISIDARQTNCRKVYISWHKATRSVWVNFGNGDIANRVAQKFNDNKYKCLDQFIKSSAGRRSLDRGRGGSSHNPVAWTITLGDVPGHATLIDIQAAIRSPSDKPRHVEMGPVSYHASDAEVSVKVRKRLEEIGPLENFYLASATKGKRAKATAWFHDEADARSACSLNNLSLQILGGGKLTVTLVHSAKVKVRTTVYLAWKNRIDKESKTWREQHLTFHVYPDNSQRFSTLKVEGDNPKDVANARKFLQEISSGVVLTDGKNALWSPTLSSNGNTYEKLKSIEMELHIVVARDKYKRQLKFYGPPEKFQQAVDQISSMLREESSITWEIDLAPNQFSWMISGGFKNIEQALGKNVAVFNVVLRRIIVLGTQQQCNVAKTIIEGGKLDTETDHPHHLDSRQSQSIPEGTCPICFCEADNPIETSCKHIFCSECFEECCKSSASTSKTEFQIKCPGDNGNCANIFTLREVKEHLSSSVFETVLKSSFEEHIQRHPEVFRYCPTPDCGYVYRCTTASGVKLSTYTCPNCFEPICTACHARHGDYTCAEYKDIASGGYQALQKLKRELNIKDCPRCTTPMEKTEGCNHMTCEGCKAHICWVCMAVFKTSGPCYDHMNKEHGGIGIEYH